MSRINDALKQARQAAPPTVPQPLPQQGIPLRREEKSSIWGRLALAGLILFGLMALAVFVWSAHRKAPPLAVVSAPVNQTFPSPPPAASPAPVESAPVPAAVMPPTNPPPAPVVPVKPALPVLQGIFYSPTDPSAIVNGKTVHPSSRLEIYTVKEIGKSTVTLIGQDQHEIKLNMGH